MIFKKAIFIPMFILMAGQPVTAKLTPEFSIEIRNAPLSSAIRFLATIDGGNVVVPEMKEKQVTATFSKISPQDALDSILEPNGLGSIKRNRVYQILKREAVEATGKDLVSKTVMLKYSKAADIKEQLEALASSRGSILVDERINSITMRDIAPYMAQMDGLIRAIDIADRQVRIEARVVEASTNFVRNLGIQWGLSYSNDWMRVGGIGSRGADLEAEAPLNVDRPSNSPFSGLGLGLGPFGNFNLDAQLTMGENNGEASIISRPNIVTMNNQAATIQSGSTFFVLTPGNVNIGSGADSTTAAASNLEEVTTGINMVVTPQITYNGKISLSINVVQSQRDNSLEVNGIPGISESSAQTTVLLQDGETTVIGGLSHSTESDSKSGVPWLHRIPILGYLFGSTSKNKTNRELMVFVTPRIVDSADIKAVAVDNVKKP